MIRGNYCDIEKVYQEVLKYIQQLLIKNFNYTDIPCHKN